MIGGLLDAGMTLDDVLDMTFPQMQFAYEVVLEHKVQMAETFIVPIIGMFGGKRSKKGKVTQKRSNKSKSHKAEQKDAHKLMALGALGLKVT
jgi:hypothetical protein